MISTSLDLSNCADIVQIVRDVDDELAAFGKPFGLFQTKTDARCESVLRSLSTEARAEFLLRLDVFREMCQVSTGNQMKLRDDLRLVWYAISRLGVRPPSELFEFLSSGDSIEIYDMAGFQVFRNFEFCYLTTYSLTELILFPWMELYDRSEAISQQISKEVENLFERKQILKNLNIDEHIGVEKRSGSGRKFSVKMKYFAPLMDSHQQVRYLLAGSSISRIS